MNEPPGARARVALTGLTIAEHFRDSSGTDVLLFIDNIFRFTQGSYLVFLSLIFIIIKWFCCLIIAGSEVSALLGRIPSAVGYQPTLGKFKKSFLFPVNTKWTIEYVNRYWYGFVARTYYNHYCWFHYICPSKSFFTLFFVFCNIKLVFLRLFMCQLMI